MEVYESNMALSGTSSVMLRDLPEEILEQILAYLSPYREMEAACLVSKQWMRVMRSVIRQRKRHFYQNLTECSVSWTEVVREVATQERAHAGSITDRFSHSAGYHDGSMYVFGGCTSTNTTFNDLWRLDLTSRQWVRPVAMGAYPSPKACATMVVYKENLVLFGGWSHPIPYPLHQSAHYFSELHMYDTTANRWSHTVSIGQEPEALGGHSASVAGDLMVVFGGSPRPGFGTNNLWVFNFLKGFWKLQPVCRNAKPEPRYGQFQTTLDDRHILIMGGCVGQSRVYTDKWLLTLDPDGPWQWSKINVLHPELSAPQTWCHGACRVGDRIVVIAKPNQAREARNVKPRVHTTFSSPLRQTAKAEVMSGGGGSGSTSSGTASRYVQTSPQQSVSAFLAHEHQFEPQTSAARDNMLATVSASAVGAASNPSDCEMLYLAGGCQDARANLLALQQKLHRDCASLPDPDNHHHNPQRGDQAEPEGHFLRLHNRWVNESAPDFPRQPSPAVAAQHQQPAAPTQQRVAIMNPSQLNPEGHDPLVTIRARDHAKPSIRPNAMCNRQRQLEALQRQEEILRSKSRAIAAAKQKLACEKPESLDFEDMEESTPDIIPTKNKMDVYVADIGRVLSEGVAEWRPLSELQAPCAPTESICCSLLEGRSELILFGGVISPVVSNTAINKLYLLHA